MGKLRIGGVLLEQLVILSCLQARPIITKGVLTWHSHMYKQKCMLRDFGDKLEGCYTKRLWLHVVQKEVINCQVPDCLPVDR